MENVRLNGIKQSGKISIIHSKKSEIRSSRCKVKKVRKIKAFSYKARERFLIGI
jgi:hypothetical protein